MLCNIIIEQKNLKKPKNPLGDGEDEIRTRAGVLAPSADYKSESFYPFWHLPSPLYGEADSPASLKMILSQTHSIEQLS